MNKPVPVYRQIADNLRMRIDSREMTGKLPGQRELSKHYSVNVITMRNALKIIEDDGLIHSIPSKGFFIRKLNGGIARNRIAGLLLTTEGHLYSEMTSLLATGFQERDYFPLIINTLRHQFDKRLFQRQAEQLIGSEPAAILVDGHREFPFEIFRKNRKYIENLTLVFRDEHDFGDALRVLSDEAKGGRDGVLHLMRQGCERILFLMPPKSAFLLIPGAERALKGALEALTEKGGSSYNIHYTEETGSMELAALLNNWRPDGVFAFADYLLMPVYEHAKHEGVKIPDDLALLGYYNTPWCESYAVPLSSVSVEIGKLVDIAVEKTIGNMEKGLKNTETIKVAPCLVERDSTRRMKHKADVQCN